MLEAKNYRNEDLLDMYRRKTIQAYFAEGDKHTRLREELMDIENELLARLSKNPH